jgi:membrane protein YqaA with SNARE-associated domain
MLDRLYHWMMRMAADRRAALWLGVVCFVESSVFPIPPDVMLVPMVLADRAKAWRYALIAVLSSVAGGWLGYAIGHFLYESIGRTIVAFYHMEPAFAAFQEKFREYGVWIVVIKGLTPIPFKLVTIASGVAGLNLALFTVAAIASRSIRFVLVAGLLRAFGEPIQRFIERRLTLVTTVFAALVVGGFLILKLV